MWVVSVFSFLTGLVTMAAVRNWASLTTNRTLLSNLLRVYLCACLLLWVFTLWLTCVLFLTFGKVKDWSVSISNSSFYAFYLLFIHLPVIYFYHRVMLLWLASSHTTCAQSCF